MLSPTVVLLSKTVPGKVRINLVKRVAKLQIKLSLFRKFKNKKTLMLMLLKFTLYIFKWSFVRIIFIPI